MSFGLCRIRKISTAKGMQYTDIHNGRKYQEHNLHPPPNIRPEQKYGLNDHDILLSGCSSIEEAVEKRIKDAGVKVRSNSVKAIEYVLALSPDVQHVFKNYSAHTALDRMLEFVEKRHGKENVISKSLHFDESNPHVHFVVVPITTKEKHWKNRNGSGVKVENTLTARDFVGGRDKLRDMQTDFYEFCKNTYADRLNIVFTRGTDARENSKKYTKHASAEMGELRGREAELITQLANVRSKQEQAQKVLYNREAQQKEEKKQQHGKQSFDKLNPFKGYPDEGKISPLKDKKGTNKDLSV